MLDLFIKIIFVYLLYRGWSKGLLRSILGPFSLIICLLISLFYYKNTGKVLYAIGISVLGPFIFTFTASLLLKAWNKSSDNSGISIPSRIAGSIFSLLWSGTYIIALMILILHVPSNAGFLQKMQDHIRTSQIYSLLKKWPAIDSLDSKNIMRVFQTPEKTEKIKQSKEFQTLLKNDKFKKVLNDEEVQALIKDKDITGLVSNPKVQSILKDKKLFKQFMDANKMIIEEASGKKEEEDKNIKPYVLDIKQENKEN